MAELADAHDLGSCGATRGGSSPLIRTSYVSDFQRITPFQILDGDPSQYLDRDEQKIGSEAAK